MADFNTLLAVKDLMASNLVTASSSVSVVAAAKTMEEKEISSIVLVGGDGTIDGIVTETDIVRKAVAKNADTDTITAGSIMSKDVHKINSDTSIFEARETMQSLSLKHLIVEENGKPIGVVSASALLGS